MKYAELFLLMLFWFGMFLLLYRGRMSVRERAEYYINKGRMIAENGRPGKLLRAFRNYFRKSKIDNELSISLSYIKNVAALGIGQRMTGEYILEDLSDICDVLKPVYLDMAHYMHLNDKASAAICLENAVDTPFARDMASLLSGWEDIPPADLENTILLYQSALAEERNTKQAQKDEMISDIIYFPVVVNCMVILLNFINVSYFINQKEALGMFF